MNKSTPINIPLLNEKFSNASPEEILDFMLKQFGDQIAMASSLSAEDQVLTHMMLTIDPNARIFTLDTGRLFPETYDLIDRTNARYNTRIEVFFPESAEVEAMVKEEGVNLFYHSIENRKRCCHVRKVEPLIRAFSSLRAWISGLRREQSVTRTEVQQVEWDKTHSLVKVNPLIAWGDEQVWDYIHQHNIPYNPLHKKGFASIGCQPCTRAIEPGEHPRAGRWWWENPESRECGLHVNKA